MHLSVLYVSICICCGFAEISSLTSWDHLGDCWHGQLVRYTVYKKFPAPGGHGDADPEDGRIKVYIRLISQKYSNSQLTFEGGSLFGVPDADNVGASPHDLHLVRYDTSLW